MHITKQYSMAGPPYFINQGILSSEMFNINIYTAGL